MPEKNAENVLTLDAFLATFLATFLARLLTTHLTFLRSEVRKSHGRTK